jgi:hypothetical protein
MRSARHLWLLSTLGALVLGLGPTPALAVRPFVTDDARIIDRGQLEVESWLELSRYQGSLVPALNVIAGVSFTDWLEVLAGGGMGMDPGPSLTVANPVIQSKLLLMRTGPGWLPGVALAGGVTLPTGRGSLYDDATGLFLIAPLTLQPWGDELFIHVNVGMTGTRHEGRLSARPFWGLGVDVSVHPRARVIGEVYSGDPFEALGPEVAAQAGVRWHVREGVDIDITFGAAPGQDELRQPTGRVDLWAQLGLRMVFDTFRRTPGDMGGAPGLFPRPSRRGG